MSPAEPQKPPGEPEAGAEATAEPSAPVDPAEASRSADKPPKKRGRPKGSKNKPKGGSSERASKAPSVPAEIREIAKQLEALLTAPSFAFEMMGEEWPKNHVDRQGKILAAEIAAYAQKNAAFKARLQAFLSGGENTKLILAGVMYVVPLGIYFGTIPAPDRVRAMMGIPYRPRSIAPAPDDVPQEIREGVEKEAVENGFTFEDGTPDVESYLNAIREGVEEMRNDAPTS